MAGEGHMDAVPARAHAYVAGVVLAAPGLPAPPCPQVHTPWWAVLLLAGLYAGSELVARSRFVGTCYPVLLAGAFLLPPPPPRSWRCPGPCLSPVAQRPFALRRVWRAAQLTLAVWAAARVHWGCGGRDAVVAPDFPARARAGRGRGTGVLPGT